MYKNKVYRMTKQVYSLTQSPEWQALSTHLATTPCPHLRECFKSDQNRHERFTLRAAQLTLDYSRQRISQETINLLINLAKAADLPAHIQALFSNNQLNLTENRAVMHTALRQPNTHQAIAVDIRATLNRMRRLTDDLHAGRLLGVTGKPIKHVITIGMGGSLLGPKLACVALKEAAVYSGDFHFMATADQALREDIFSHIDLEESLFIISSKTFTTYETMQNTKACLSQLTAAFGQDVIKHHVIAVTAAEDKALALGIPPDRIFPMWEWVGGRFSVWSAIGLPLMLMIGADAFDAFLEGAAAMDQHFQTAPLAANMPVILALLGIWNINFQEARAHAIIPYAHRLRYLIPYLRQAEMESNGKSVDLDGNKIDYHTAPVIFGEEGCSGQHAYHQLLHQGTQLIPADFIFINHPSNAHECNDQVMLASGLSQAEALMQGKTEAEAARALQQINLPEARIAVLAKHQTIDGNKPSNLIFLDQLTPYHLGALLALYEHKIFTQGVIWHINSFDQWGVELGKQLLPTILNQLKSESHVYEEA